MILKATASNSNKQCSTSNTKFKNVISFRFSTGVFELQASEITIVGALRSAISDCQGYLILQFFSFWQTMMLNLFFKVKFQNSKQKLLCFLQQRTPSNVYLKKKNNIRRNSVLKVRHSSLFLETSQAHRHISGTVRAESSSGLKLHSIAILFLLRLYSDGKMAVSTSTAHTRSTLEGSGQNQGNSGQVCNSSCYFLFYLAFLSRSHKVRCSDHMLTLLFDLIFTRHYRNGLFPRTL